MPTLKHIVILNPAATLGGAEQCLLDIVQASSNSRFTVILFEAGPLESKLRDLGVDVEILPLPPQLAVLGDSGGSKFGLLWKILFALPKIFGFAKTLRERLTQLKPDVIHSNGMKTHLISALAKYSDATLIWYIHDFVSQRKLMPWLLKRYAKVPDRILANSNSTAQDCETIFPKDKIGVLYNGIDAQRFSPQGEKMQFEGSLNIGLVATYARWKGQDIFLRAAAAVQKAFPEQSIHFVIVGGPIYQTQGSQFSREELVQIASKLQLSPPVQFIEFTQDPDRVYRGLDIVVHASTKPEPFGRTIAEAMSCARATVVANSGGAAEIIEPGISALSYSLSDEHALAQEIIKLVKDSGLRKRIATNARMRVLSNFSYSQLTKRLNEVYELSAEPKQVPPVRSAL